MNNRTPIIVVCLILAFAALSHSASVANEEITSEEANKFLSRSKRSFYEECIVEGCDLHEIMEIIFGMVEPAGDGPNGSGPIKLDKLAQACKDQACKDKVAKIISKRTGKKVEPKPTRG